RTPLAGPTSEAFSEEVAMRYEAYGWHVQDVGEDLSLERLESAARTAIAESERPSLIMVRSHIGYGSPHKQDTSGAHGSPLGEEEVRLAKRSYGWPEGAKFLVPDGVYEHFAGQLGSRGKQLRAQWLALFERYKSSYPQLAEQC